MDAKIPIDFDQLRREFAERIEQLIKAESGEKKLETFSQSAGIAMRQASQWANRRHINWPSAANLITMALYKDLSPSYLLVGEGKPYISEFSKIKVASRDKLEVLVSILKSITPRNRRRMDEILKEMLGDDYLQGTALKAVRGSSKRSA